MIRVGFWEQTYSEKRNILNSLNRGKVEYIPIRREEKDVICRLLPGIKETDSGIFESRKKWYYHPIAKPDCDIIHCFNGVCNTTLPWMSYFETMLPRVLHFDGNAKVDRWWLKHQCALLAKDNCKALFAISQSARGIEEHWLESYAGEYKSAILSKIKVVHPYQKVIATEEQICEKNKSVKECIEFLIVGTGFFFKGGKEAVEALAWMKQHGGNVRLTIVSNFMQVPGQLGYTKNDYRECMQLIRKNSDWITVYRSLPNKQVLRLMQKAHVGLFPSYGDTYGFACLEFQACGCPVVTSNVRAFPEINNDQCGWIFPIDQSLSGREKQERNRTYLKGILEDILSHPEQIEEKAVVSLKRIREEHDPQKHADRMLQEYRSALGYGGD